MDEASFETLMEEVEYSETLSSAAIEAACSSMAFTQAFHDFMSDWRMVNTVKVDHTALEKAFEALVAEYQAACIFLASFTGVEEKLLATHTALTARKDDSVPSVVINGYKKLAERVAHTRASFTADSDEE